MDLIRNSGLDPVPDGLLVQLKDRLDLGHRHELVGMVRHTPTLTDLVDPASALSARYWADAGRRRLSRVQPGAYLLRTVNALTRIVQ